MQVLERPEFAVPLYNQAEAARLVDVPANTLHDWATGHSYLTLDGQRTQKGLVTVVPVGRSLRLPFLGLAEAYVIASLKLAGLPMQRIRPAVEKLKAEMGLTYALLSDRLMTDGAEVLFEYVGEEDEGLAGGTGLTRVRDKQLMFRDAVENELSSVSYEDGFATELLPRQFAGHVFVNPLINGGQPSFVESGVRVEDARRRRAAGEPLRDVANDFDIPVGTLTSVLGRD